MKRMSRAIVVAFHKYTPFGGEFYAPIFDYFIKNIEKYKAEYDTLYLIDSTWDINQDTLPSKAKIIKVNQHLRYYDAYKSILPEIKELLVLFVDNDTVIYKEGVIDETFNKLEGKYDVVSIYDTIGTFTTPLLNGKSKFCPYWFATGTAMLKDFTKCEWGPVDWGETLSELTKEMLDEEVIPFEQEEDKSSLLVDGTEYYPNNTGKGKDLGYYHIRAGSTVAYLLATEKYGDMETYKSYLNNQPKMEYLRHCAWYQIMGGSPERIVMDAGVDLAKWYNYVDRFKEYHGI